MSRTTARTAAMQMIFERVSGGQGGEETLRMVYDELRQGHPLSREIRGAESYLIDYYAIFVPEKYKKWSQEYEGLTPHMYTYLILMDMNYSDSDIQRILSISPSSLRSLRSRIMSRRIM